MGFKVDPRRLENARRFTQKNIINKHERYGAILDDIFVDPHPTAGAFVVATTGHIMLVQYDPLADMECPCLYGHDLKRKAIFDSPEKISYPDWRYVVPDWTKLRKGFPGFLDSRYLRIILDYVNPTDGILEPVCIAHDPDKPTSCVITFGEVEDAFIVLAELKLGEPVSQPLWLSDSYDPADGL